MFGPNFQSTQTGHILDQYSNKTNKINPDKDRGFDAAKSNTCGHLNTGKARYVPEVEFTGNVLRVYCKQIEANQLQHVYNEFSTIYSTYMTDIASKFISMKQVIMAMFQSLDEYDKEAIACGLLIMFPDDEMQAKYTEECSTLKQEVVRVIETVDNDLKLCNGIQSEMFSSEAEKKVKAAQQGCLPVQVLHKRIISELDYILQRYQDHIVKVLGIAHKHGEHAESKGLWAYIKHKGGQAIETVKRGLHKLLTFLHRNWDYVMGTMLLTLGPLVFFGIPAIAGSAAGFFTSLTAAGGLSDIAFSTICNFLTKIPIVGYSLYKIIGGMLIQFFGMSPEEKVQKFGKTAEKWTKELEKHQKTIFSNLGLNVSAAGAKVSAFVAGPAFGTIMAGTQVVGQVVGKQVEYVKAEFQKEKVYGQQALEFSATVLKSGVKYWMIYGLQKVGSTTIALMCAGGEILKGILEAIKSLFNVSYLWGGKGLGEVCTDLVEKVGKQLGLVSLYAGTGPIRFLIETFKLIATYYSSEGIEGVVNRVLQNDKLVSGLLQLIVWIISIYFGLKKLLHFGNVPPLAKNIAKMTPLLRSKIIDEGLDTLRLPVLDYLPVEILPEKSKITPEIKRKNKKTIQSEIKVSRNENITSFFTKKIGSSILSLSTKQNTCMQAGGISMF